MGRAPTDATTSAAAPAVAASTAATLTKPALPYIGFGRRGRVRFERVRRASLMSWRESRVTALPEVEYASRRERFRTAMAAAGLDTVFLPPSSDLEYLTGVERDLPSFGQIAYAHGWVTGTFFSVDSEPVFVLPRMVVTFHLGDAPPEGTIVVAETDDAEERLRDAVGRAGPIHRLGIGARTWGETVLGLERIARPEEIREVSSLVNELRRTKSPAEIDAMALACEKAEQIGRAH